MLITVLFECLVQTYSVAFRLFKLTFFTGSEHLGFSGNNLMAVPPKPLTPIRRKSFSVFIFTDSTLLILRLFPITAKDPTAPEIGTMQQPAVHMDPGMLTLGAVPAPRFLSGIFWIASSLPDASTSRLTSEMPVIRYRSPPFGLHPLLAYSLM